MIKIHPKDELTYVMIKPDGVKRGYVGNIISRLERTGLKLVAIKMTMATEDQCWKHYNKDDAWFVSKGEKTIKNRKDMGLPIEKEAIEYGKDILRGNVEFMTSDPIICMIWEGNQAIGIVKKIVGTTEPLTSDVGTIRGDLTIDSYELANMEGRAVRNLIHCSDESDEPGAAMREIAIWFPEESEIMKYESIQEKILYYI